MAEAALTPPWREAKKVVKAQQKRDAELKPVHALIEGKPLEPDTDDLLSADIPIVKEAEILIMQVSEPFESEVDDDEDDHTFEPLEEW